MSHRMEWKSIGCLPFKVIFLFFLLRELLFGQVGFMTFIVYVLSSNSFSGFNVAINIINIIGKKKISLQGLGSDMSGNNPLIIKSNNNKKKNQAYFNDN